MTLSSKEITLNYKNSLKLAAELRKQHLRDRGYEEGCINEADEIIFSAVSDPELVEMIKAVPFEKKIYTRPLYEALDRAGKELFPDLSKKRFISIENVELHTDEIQEDESNSPPVSAGHIDNIIRYLMVGNAVFLQEKLLPLYPEWRGKLYAYQIEKPNNSGISIIKKLDDQLCKIRLCYPDGRIEDTSGINGFDELDEETIISVYKNVYCGIERRFPENFLKKNGEKRAALITRFLVEKLLNLDSLRLAEDADETFFIRHKLQSIYRFFNYSANRALRNAYPALIPTWLNSRTGVNYWEEIDNRRRAVRWLVEHKLGMTSSEIRRAKIRRNDFSRKGLSFMFNKYYNSVSKALAEAYPKMLPWELGSVHMNFWTVENSAKAVRRMIELQGWSPDQLPELVRSKQFNRKIFSRYGLTTLFEKKFGRNIYRAVEAAFPGQFRPWELGNVPGGFWQSRKNWLSILFWIAGKEGIAGDQVFKAVDENKITENHVKKYSIGKILLNHLRGNLTSLFNPVYEKQYRRQKLVSRLNNYIRRERDFRSWKHILLYGIGYPAVCRVSMETEDHYRRMLKRMTKNIKHAA